MTSGHTLIPHLLAMAWNFAEGTWYMKGASAPQHLQIPAKVETTRKASLALTGVMGQGYAEYVPSALPADMGFADGATSPSQDQETPPSGRLTTDSLPDSDRVWPLSSQASSSDSGADGTSSFERGDEEAKAMAPCSSSIPDGDSVTAYETKGADSTKASEARQLLQEPVATGLATAARRNLERLETDTSSVVATTQRTLKGTLSYAARCALKELGWPAHWMFSLYPKTNEIDHIMRRLKGSKCVNSISIHAQIALRTLRDLRAYLWEEERLQAQCSVTDSQSDRQWPSAYRDCGAISEMSLLADASRDYTSAAPGSPSRPSPRHSSFAAGDLGERGTLVLKLVADAIALSGHEGEGNCGEASLLHGGGFFAVGDRVTACFYGEWHPATVRRLDSEGNVEVLWESEWAVTLLPATEVLPLAPQTGTSSQCAFPADSPCRPPPGLAPRPQPPTLPPPPPPPPRRPQAKVQANVERIAAPACTRSWAAVVAPQVVQVKSQKHETSSTQKKSLAGKTSQIQAESEAKPSFSRSWADVAAPRRNP